MPKQTQHLFVYGSLMYDEVLHQIVSGRYQKTPAKLNGYRCLQVKNESYPGLIPHTEAITPGLLIYDVSLDDIHALDDFEGEYYQRIDVGVETDTGEQSAAVYLFKDEYRALLSAELWLAEDFKDKVIERFRDVHNDGVYR